MPKTFQDTTGREWSIALTLGAMRRVKAALRVDLLQPLEPLDGPAESKGRAKKKAAAKPALMTEIGSDTELFVDVLYVLCKPAADAAEISDEQFGEVLGAQHITDAHDAFFHEWSDFFRLRRRPEVVELMAKQQKYLRTVIELAAEKMRDPKIDAAATQKMKQTLGKSLKDLQASPGATPTRSRSAN